MALAGDWLQTSAVRPSTWQLSAWPLGLALRYSPRGRMGPSEQGGTGSTGAAKRTASSVALLMET